jgi:D-3-phosphoglycerate dehydrogenase
MRIRKAGEWIVAGFETVQIRNRHSADREMPLEGENFMKIVISDCDHASIDQEIAATSAVGLPAPAWLKCRTEEDVIRDCKGAASILNQYAPMSRKVIAALAPELKQIVRYGVGVNNIDVEAATEFGVLVCRVPDYGMHEVSDHAMALMLALCRKLVPMCSRTREGEWEYQEAIPVRRLCGQTVGTVGVGRNGRLFARKSAAFGCRVIGYDPYYQCEPGDDAFITLVSLDELIRDSDYIALNCPLTDETRNLFSDAAFMKMKPSACLVNTSRGGIVDEAALARAFENGRIAGAALDVAVNEPLEKDSPLRKFDNCLLTPHMAWYSEEAAKELKRKAAEEAVFLVTGKSVRYPVNTPKA